MNIIICMKNNLKKYIPKKLLRILSMLIHPALLYEYFIAKNSHLIYKIIVRKNKNKPIYKVAFFVTHSSVWKYDYLFYLMREHEQFDPTIVVCPVVNYGRDNMLVEMDRSYKFFSNKGFKVVRAYDEERDKYIDIRREVNPDIIFYTNPYRGLIDDRYFITRFLDRLTCYVPYSASICNTPMQFNKFLSVVAWKFFLENELSSQIAKNEMHNRAVNVVVSGYPACDVFLSGMRDPINVWKHHQKIKIIWAPHHSFDEECSVHFANFFEVSETLVLVREKYKDCVQIAFKPHPLLYVKLLNVWGKQRTDEYYEAWAQGQNSQYEDGDYLDLFMTSDAMIFDSVSFIYEYLFTKKPSLFINGQSAASQLNEFGKKALRCHQQGNTQVDIEHFIEAVIAGKPDSLTEEKQRFYNKYIVPANGKLASQNIIDNILESLSA